MGTDREREREEVCLRQKHSKIKHHQADEKRGGQNSHATLCELERQLTHQIDQQNQIADEKHAVTSDERNVRVPLEQVVQTLLVQSDEDVTAHNSRGDQQEILGHAHLFSRIKKVCQESASRFV